VQRLGGVQGFAAAPVAYSMRARVVLLIG